MARLIGGSLLIGVLACGAQSPGGDETSGEDAGYLAVIPLTNEEFSIVEMATAHGAFTLEVEVDLGADTDSIARRLIEPVQDRYAEVLVYFYDRTGDGDLPISRVQWTADDGYSEITY